MTLVFLFVESLTTEKRQLLKGENDLRGKITNVFNGECRRCIYCQCFVHVPFVEAVIMSENAFFPRRL